MANLRPSIVLALVTVTLGLTEGESAAQAWVGPKGGLDLSLDYNFAFASMTIANSDVEFPDSGVQSHELRIGAEYVPIDRLAVNLAIPFVALKYTGDRELYMHPGGARYDDGSYHATPTDLRLGARYAVIDAPVAVSPHLGVTIPMADYETIGNAVPGRHLKALHLGVSVGRVVAETWFVHLMYELSLVEKYDRTEETAKHGQSRSDLAFTVGKRLLDDRLNITLGANARNTHGGVSLTLESFAMLSPNEQRYHDAILDEDIILAGGGVGYQLTDTLSVDVAARIFLWGTNTINSNVLGLSLAWIAL